MATLLILDGNSLMHRAYYGLAGRARLTSPEGVPTGALLSFLNMLLAFRERFSPDHLYVAFDRPEPTFRHLKFKEYKAKRSATPDDLVVQLRWIRTLLDEMQVARGELAGYEADDLIGTLARRGSEAGLDVIVVSGDKDTLQLIDERIRVLLPVTRAGQSEQKLIDRALFLETFGVTPDQYVDVKALMGDQSDNIPGVRGIGEKTATSLIARYGSLEGVYEHLEELPPGQRQYLQSGRDDAYTSRELSLIDRLVPLDVELADLASRPPAPGLVKELQKLGMRQLLSRLGLAGDTDQDPLLERRQKLPQALSPEVFLAKLPAEADLALGVAADTVCLYEETVGHAFLTVADLAQLDPSAGAAKLVLWDYKSLLHQSQASPFVRLPFDVFVAQSLIEPSGQTIDLAQTYGRWSETPLPTADNDQESALIAALALAGLRDSLQARLRQDGLERLFQEVEMPLVPVLAGMERRGVLIDRVRLLELATDMAADIEKLEGEIYAEVGHAFNLNSPKQLATVLYEELKLPTGRRSGSGQYSTSAEELDRLAAVSPLVVRIKEHRQLAKLHATFLTGLEKEIAEDGRIHTTYNQVATATGRLSSEKPNLQNIPVRSERGREIRGIFVAAPGYTLLDADYAQIELRLLAHLASDERLKEAFAEGQDVHARTASDLFQQPIERVTAEQRAIAKTVNFSIVYGVGDFGLAKSLGSTVAEAHEYIAGYNRLYRSVRDYLEGQKEKAYADGYVTTLWGRRRYMHELKSQNRTIRQFGERAAMNAPVQGTAADLIKMAMVRADRAFREQGLDAHLLLQVHDELLVEVRAEEKEKAAALLRAAMEGAMTLDVSLIADVSQGESWEEAKL